MFKCVDLLTLKVTTVYSVDFNHDAFLVVKNGAFKWRPMNEFRPIDAAAIALGIDVESDTCIHDCAKCWKTKLVNPAGEVSG